LDKLNFFDQLVSGGLDVTTLNGSDDDPSNTVSNLSEGNPRSLPPHSRTQLEGFQSRIAQLWMLIFLSEFFALPGGKARCRDPKELSLKDVLLA
jgi:hypothetical protein